ncbi:MAG: helicase-related protein, partial [Myxococcota bacterium]
MGSGLSPLPIDDHVPAALASLRAGRNLVVLAEPGAGKTTRLPRAMLLAEAPAASGGEILVLEPRRIAARLAARRVASELGEAVGGRVGYTVRFEDRRGPATRLRFVTEGILVRQLARDATLPGVAAVVLDEFHERHLAGDLALAMLRRLQRRSRPELRLVAMSATLDPGPIAAFLAADVLRVPGRTHPVSLVHLGAPKEALERSVARAVRQALGDDGDGDVLVFLPGAGAIRRAEQACLPLARGGVELAMLHGDLPPDAQDRVLRPASGRKVILSTNVAESSVTLPAVTAVVDAGLVRRASVSPLTGLPVLATVPISQASATQRAGRAGRVRPGRAYRLFTEAELRRRPAADTPEIGRADLAELALLLRAQGEDPRRFPFFEAPPSEALDAALALLRRLRALEGKDRVTARGRALLRLPAHPRLGTVVLEAKAQDVGWRGARVAALIA